MRVLIAGLGNVLRGDDGFGIAVVERLADRPGLPPGAVAQDFGIGGVRLVQELMAGYDALVLVDAVARGGEPGRLYVLDVDVPDPAKLSTDECRELVADMHQTDPTRVLVHARALGVLPPRVWIVGCEPAYVDELTTELSPAVRAAVAEAERRILELLESVRRPCERSGGVEAAT